jgi:hypothetical protein
VIRLIRRGGWAGAMLQNGYWLPFHFSTDLSHRAYINHLLRLSFLLPLMLGFSSSSHMVEFMGLGVIPVIVHSQGLAAYYL